MSGLSSGPVCPAPGNDGETIQLAHGGGGRAMNRLIETLFRPAFDNIYLAQAHDGATVEAAAGPLAMTTDSYVVRPLFFPGGDIGALAVNGTVNDLVMCGARPRYLSAGFILEEGLPLATLRRVVESMARAATDAGTPIVTGDVKVVDRGKADGLYINTAGIGEVIARSLIGPASVRAGDAVIVSGDIGRHGVAVMAAREDLALETEIVSDCTSLAAPVLALLEAGIDVHCLRDLTRGGLASALIEVAQSAALSIAGEETAIPVRDDVRSACELLGLDPLYVANEGRFAAFVPQRDAARALRILSECKGADAAGIIGHVEDGAAGRVALRGPFGTSRVIDMLSGEQLPRIC